MVTPAFVVVRRESLSTYEKPEEEEEEEEEGGQSVGRMLWEGTCEKPHRYMILVSLQYCQYIDSFVFLFPRPAIQNNAFVTVTKLMRQDVFSTAMVAMWQNALG